MKLKLTLLFCFLIKFLYAQNIIQTVRGTVVDKINQQALPGASIVLLPGEFITTSTNGGDFFLENIPVGRYTLKVSFSGYETTVINELIVGSGKQSVLRIELQPSIVLLGEASVTSNESDIEAMQYRSLTVEQSERYAAAFNDVARMAAYYPGVINLDDGNNHISVHGNSPATVLWRLDGIDLLNPNHLANGGTFSDRPSNSSGGVSMLSTQMIDNTRFYTNPFDASFTNASSGIFEMKLRKGNNQSREFTAQAGLIGLDFSGEGYFRKDRPSSYLFNYRYSTVGLLEKMGVQFGDEAISFQDMSFNLCFPFENESELTVFGITGMDENIFKVKTDTSEWEVIKDSKDINYNSHLGIIGATYVLPVSSKTLWKTSVAAQTLYTHRDETKYNDQIMKLNTIEEDGTENKYALHTYFNLQLNTKHLLATGLMLNYYHHNYNDVYTNDSTASEISNLKTSLDGLMTSVYADWNWQATGKLQIKAGINLNQFSYSNTFEAEPRFSLGYNLCKKASLSFNYSYSSQYIPFRYYAYELSVTDEYHLEPYQSQYISLVYQHQLHDNLVFRIEPYWQYQTNVPVLSLVPGGYSVLNEWESLSYYSLGNGGTGQNKGLDVSLQQFLTKRFYYLISAGVFDARYKGSDQIQRNKRFNNSYSFNTTAGYEFKSESEHSKKIWGINMHFVYAGGLRETPIDVAASEALGYTIYEKGSEFENKLKDYARLDIRLTLRKNKMKWNQLFAIDIQNVLGTENESYNYYDAYQNQVATKYQLGLIPNFSWKAEF